MSNYRKYKIIKKVFETSSVVSLYLKPEDGAPLENFKPGQHLLFKVNIPGEEIPFLRYYSFSDSYNEQYYRISVKKEPAPKNAAHTSPGQVSSYFFDNLLEGNILEARGPMGSFHLSATETSPVILLAGGIGITPLLCMAKSILKVQPLRKVFFLYGINNSEEHGFAKELSLLKKTFPNFFLASFYANPLEKDIQGDQYDHNGFIDLSILKNNLLGTGAGFYICGPAIMMDFIKGKLKQMGVSDSQINLESFSATNGSIDAENQDSPSLKPSSQIQIEFIKSKKKLYWDSRYKSLLAFAENNDININSGCLFGDCGTCLTKVTGKVKYIHPTMVKVKEGECLPCSCVPVENISINA